MRKCFHVWKSKMAAEVEGITSFHEFGLDDRLLKAISKLNWSQPTAIQEKAIPLALEGKDILARAKTGSGKTGAYAIPTIQRILHDKQTSPGQAVRALVLVPTKELSQQAYRNMKELSSYCSRDIKVADVAQGSIASTKPLLLEKPDVVVGTPSGVLGHIKAKNLDIKTSLQMLIIDEADFVFSFGYEDDLKGLLSKLPKIYQAFLMSATLTEVLTEGNITEESKDVKALKKLILHNPVTLKLEESHLPDKNRLTQYFIKCELDDKFLLIYTLLKLKLIRGKTLLFVNGIDRCYRLKLFLEQFSIKACVLNSELPHNSRLHIMDEFNRDMYDYIIASDETVFESAGGSNSAAKPTKKKRKKDKEYGVSRGIDFQGVENVVNFDFPPTVASYIHRVGRTARGDNMGTALSFVTAGDQDTVQRAEEELTKDSSDTKDIFRPYQFKMKEIEGFRYRARDALRAVTKASVREARLKEIKSEILNSEKLKAYFEDNPRDLQVLRHDKFLHPTRIQPHLKNVPDYLVPPTLRPSMVKSRKRKRLNVSFHGNSQNKSGQSKQKRKSDPLRSFKFNRQQAPNKKGSKKVNKA